MLKIIPSKKTVEWAIIPPTSFRVLALVNKKNCFALVYSS